MDTISQKELTTFLNIVDDERIKKILSEIVVNQDEISIDDFFEKIKSVENLASIDYKLFLLLEEFYLRYKRVKNDWWYW